MRFWQNIDPRRIQAIEKKIGWYGKYFGIPSTLALPILIFIILLVGDFLSVGKEGTVFGLQTLMVSVLWVVLIFNLLLFTVDAFLSDFGVRLILLSHHQSGVPLQAIRGFDSILQSLKEEKQRALLLTLLAIIGDVFFMLGWFSSKDEANIPIIGDLPISIVFYLFAVFMLFLIFSVNSLRKISSTPVFDYQGGLSPFHTINEYPTVVRDVLSDNFAIFLDPLSFLKYDNWSQFLKKIIKRPNISETDFRRLRELVLYLFYLYMSFPPINETLVREKINLEFNNPRAYDLIKKYEYLNHDRILTNLRRMKKEIPHFFRIIDGLFLQLKDNWEEFTTTSVYYDTAIPLDATSGSVTRILIFLFNNDPKYEHQKKKVRIKVLAPGWEPDELTFDVALDPRQNIPLDLSSGPLPIVSLDENVDMIDAIAAILQVADAFWITLRPKNTGRQGIQILVEDVEMEAVISGSSVDVRVHHDLRDILKRVVGLGGAALAILLSFLEVVFSLPP